MARTHPFVLLALLLFVTACTQSQSDPDTERPTPAYLTADPSDPSAIPQPAPTQNIPPSTPVPINSPVFVEQSVAGVTATPFILNHPSDPCGQLLPTVLERPAAAETERWNMPPNVKELVPSSARPALEYFFDHPDDVAIVVYRAGYEGIGFFHNEEVPMPLASVSKIIQLIAYDRAVATGEIDPAAVVPLEKLEAYYLPGTDLGAHQQALRALSKETLTQSDIAEMMIRYSANSATDFIHYLIGQTEVEQTVIDLGMGPHSAPCPFLGRLIGMGELSQAEMHALVLVPSEYGVTISKWTDHYREDSAFRTAAQRLWSRGRTPSLANQAFFVDQFETRGTAAGYASLMTRIATGQVGSDELRRQLEWPWAAFPENQARYERIGYKNGTMPGVLTTVYYSQPLWADTPVVVALFYKNLPAGTYRQWRRTLPHDALAHWLMSNPRSIHIMHVWRDTARSN